MKTSRLGLMDVLGLSRRILARFLQTFNSKVYGVPTVLRQPGPYFCHVKEVDAVAEVLRPLWKTMPVDAEGFIEIRSLWYLAHQYLFSQASSSKFRIVQSSSWDVVDLSPRVPNFDEIRLCSLMTWDWYCGSLPQWLHSRCPGLVVSFGFLKFCLLSQTTLRIRRWTCSISFCFIGSSS